MDDNGASTAVPEDISCDSFDQVYQAALKAIAAGKMKKGIPLAPWEEMVFFEAPKWNTLTLSSSTAQTLVGADPHRVGVMIQTSDAIRVCTDYTHLTKGGGFSFSAGVQCMLSFLQKHWAVLAQRDWYVIAPGGSATVEVCELLLNDWPK